MKHFVHPSAIVDDGAEIGTGTKVWHWSHVCAGAKIGNDCSFGQNVFIGNRVTIGSNVRIQNNVSVYDGVTLEDDVFCGPSMVFTNVINPRAHVSRKDEFRATTVRRGASIGANATIVCGVELGRYSFVAAGAVINKNVRPFAVMAGVPARRIAWMCRCGESLRDARGHTKCPACQARYDVSELDCEPLSFE